MQKAEECEKAEAIKSNELAGEFALPCVVE